MNNEKDFPIEVIKAMRIIVDWMVDERITTIELDYLGGVKFQPEGRYYSPIAVDMMLMKQSKEREAWPKAARARQ